MTINLSGTIVKGLLVGGLLACSDSVWACASCGCTLNVDWENLGYSGVGGLKLDVRYDDINQNDLRRGRQSVSPQTASRVVNNDEPQEVELFTRSHVATLTVDNRFANDWGLNIQVPYVSRVHETLGSASDGVTGGAGGGQYRSDTSDLGDIKVLGYYSGFESGHHFGVLAGLKLASGLYDKTGTSTDTLNPGPVDIDRGLQPGTGTTDGIVGMFYADRLNKELSYFADARYQYAFNAQQQYRPGNSLSLNAGGRYQVNLVWAAQVQINARLVQRDSGENADTISTGGKLLYLSPGLSARFNHHVSVYGFVQVPVYQNVYGVQLTPKWLGSVGLHYNF